MPQVLCIICKREFYAKPNWLKKGFGKYCSRQCQNIGRKTGKVVNCFICSKETYKTIKDLRVSKSKKYFCNKSCQTKWRNSMVFVGANHSNWKGGDSTYREVLLRSGVPMVCKRCDLNDKRILAVHHIDKNRKNNILYNLTWLCHNCHYLIHHDTKEWDKFMVAIA